MILSSSCSNQLHIAWFNGKKQVVELKPSTLTETKQLKKVTKFKALQIANFNIDIGLPTRILKRINSDEVVTLILESLLVPGKQLDNDKLLQQLTSYCELKSIEDFEIVSKNHGDTLRTLVKFWP